MIWNKVVEFLLDPSILRVGYDEALEQEQANRNRQLSLQKEMIKAMGKIEERKQNLLRAYTDPDIEMSKGEYIKARETIDQEMEDVEEGIGNIELQINNIPTPEELESLERFAEEIKDTILIDSKFHHRG